MWGKLDPGSYLMMAVVGFFAQMIIAIVLPFGGDVYEKSGKILTSLIPRCNRNPILKRILRAEKRASLKIGGLFALKKETVTEFFRIIVDNTINALISW